MRKYALIAATLVATLGLSACTDTSSPESTLASAYTAIQKGQLKDLRETLTGTALATYGTAEGLAALQGAVTGMQLKTGEPNYVGGVEHSWRHKTYNYQVEVLIRAVGTKEYSHFKNATIVCEWYRGHNFPSRDPMIDPSTPDTEECAITDLN